jgi:hypothetical protein
MALVAVIQGAPARRHRSGTAGDRSRDRAFGSRNLPGRGPAWAEGAGALRREAPSSPTTIPVSGPPSPACGAPPRSAAAFTG